MMKIRRALILLAIAAVTTRAEASPIAFSDRTTFEAAVGDFSLFDFNDPSQHPCSMHLDPSRALCTGDYGGISWSGDHANSRIQGGAFSFRVLADSTFAPDEGLRAFGFDVVGGSFQTLGNIGLAYRLMSGEETSLILAPRAFFGLLLGPQDELASLTFFVPPGTRGLGSWPAVTIDNLTVTPVPEAGTLLLLGLGISALTRIRRLR